jgi:hypothetical protein
MARAESIVSSVGLFRKATERVPSFRWIPKVQHYKIIVFDWIFSQSNGAVDKNNTKFNAKELAYMCNEWVAEVKANVPNVKLLIFAAQGRWMETSPL